MPKRLVTQRGQQLGVLQYFGCRACRGRPLRSGGRLVSEGTRLNAAEREGRLPRASQTVPGQESVSFTAPRAEESGSVFLIAQRWTIAGRQGISNSELEIECRLNDQGSRGLCYRQRRKKAPTDAAELQDTLGLQQRTAKVDTSWTSYETSYGNTGPTSWPWGCLRVPLWKYCRLKDTFAINDHLEMVVFAFVGLVAFIASEEWSDWTGRCSSTRQQSDHDAIVVGSRDRGITLVYFAVALYRL